MLVHWISFKFFHRGNQVCFSLPVFANLFDFVRSFTRKGIGNRRSLPLCRSENLLERAFLWSSPNPNYLRSWTLERSSLSSITHASPLKLLGAKSVGWHWENPEMGIMPLSTTDLDLNRRMPVGLWRKKEKCTLKCISQFLFHLWSTSAFKSLCSWKQKRT